jgi:hypothetical protein
MKNEAKAFDPQAPFIGSAGLEYACVADKILDKPANSRRNQIVEAARKAGGYTDEETYRWAKVYDQQNSADVPGWPKDLSTKSSLRALRHEYADGAANAAVGHPGSPA